MDKDKRKEMTLGEVRKKIGIQLQDRRNFLNKLLEIENFEKSIENKKEEIEEFKAQLDSTITEKDKFGVLLTGEQLKRDISFFEFKLKGLELALDYSKEDLYYIMNVNEGVMQKVENLEDLKSIINAHFILMREEYEKVKKVMQDVV